MQALQEHDLEADPRFPSGPWTGFFLQWIRPGRSIMNLEMTFHDGQLEATGTDGVGAFTFTGSYDAADGSCRWTKKYLGRHSVSYEGKTDGRGIWGVWQIRLFAGLYLDKGVFHLWPKGQEPTDETERTEKAFRAQPAGLFPGFGLVVIALLGAVVGAVVSFLVLRLNSFSS
jgi:hypothetical protein